MEFEEIYNRYFNDVFRYIWRLSGSKDIAEEITSETFFKAIRSIDKFRGECELRVWLCQIAKNCYYSYMKKNKDVTAVDIEELHSVPDPNTLSEKSVLDTLESVQIHKLLHSLPEPYKEVFMWRTFADMSFRQIGQIFRKTENWACVTYYRARMLLKDKLEDLRNEK